MQPSNHLVRKWARIKGSQLVVTKTMGERPQAHLRNHWGFPLITSPEVWKGRILREPWSAPQGTHCPELPEDSAPSSLMKHCGCSGNDAPASAAGYSLCHWLKGNQVLALGTERRWTESKICGIQEASAEILKTRLTQGGNHCRDSTLESLLEPWEWDHCCWDPRKVESLTVQCQTGKATDTCNLREQLSGLWAAAPWRQGCLWPWGPTCRYSVHKVLDLELKI